MATPKLTKLELRIMEALWTLGPSSVREIQETFPEAERPAYTTVQTMVYRLETKKVARRTHKIGNAHIFEATVARHAVQRRLVSEVLGLFGGKAQPMMAHLIQMGELTLDDVRDAERQLRDAEEKGKP